MNLKEMRPDDVKAMMIMWSKGAREPWIYRADRSSVASANKGLAFEKQYI